MAIESPKKIDGGARVFGDRRDDELAENRVVRTTPEEVAKWGAERNVRASLGEISRALNGPELDPKQPVEALQKQVVALARTTVAAFKAKK